MTQTVQTSVFSHSRLYSKRYYPGNIYEVEADTFAQATEQAEQMAMDLMADITYIEVYKA